MTSNLKNEVLTTYIGTDHFYFALTTLDDKELQDADMTSSPTNDKYGPMTLNLSPSHNSLNGAAWLGALTDRTRLSMTDLTIFQYKRNREPFEDLPLHVDQSLAPSAQSTMFKCRDRLRRVFVDTVPALSVSVRVIQQVEYRRPEEMLQGILSLPGIHAASTLLVPSIHAGGTLAAMMAVCPATLAQKLSRMNIQPHPHTKYLMSFAPLHHANLFGWLRFSGLEVKNLTVRILGVGLWDHYSFTASLNYHRALPIISLVASIIAFKPPWTKKITITGLNVFTQLIRQMWDAIPERTPITGSDALLDMLVKYPFPEEMSEIEEAWYEGDGLKRGKREGNLFGLRTVGQWQAMIIRARHDKNQPEWKFAQKGWGTYVVE